MRSILAFIVGLTCLGTAHADSNLLPNGDFSSQNQVSGWSGDMVFNGALNAAGTPGSGALMLSTNDDGDPVVAVSSCFAVTPNAAFSYGGQVYIPPSFNTAPSVAFTCSAYQAANCSGGPIDLAGSSVGAGVQEFGSLQLVGGLLPGNVRSANCQAAIRTTFFQGPQGSSKESSADFDNLQFNSTDPAPVPITLDGYMSGNWFDPAQSGQGFQLDFSDQESILLAEWFTFGPDKRPLWIYAQGVYDRTGNTVSVPAAIYSGSSFGPNFRSSDIQQTLWGTLTFTFADCDHGAVSWNSTVPGYGNGSMQISRLSGVRGTTCPP
jgi:hypothetical protein